MNNTRRAACPPGHFFDDGTVVGTKRHNKPHIKYVYGAWRDNGVGHYADRIAAARFCHGKNLKLGVKFDG